MKTAEQREKEFREDFAKLLEKHGAFLAIDSNESLEISMPSIKSGDGHDICEHAFFYMDID